MRDRVQVGREITVRTASHTGKPPHGNGAGRDVDEGPDDPDQEWFDVRFHAIVTDLVGTPTELVDPDGGLSWRARTTLWGAGPPSSSAGGAVDCPLRFP
ncbi:RHS domain-containing protein, partial [Frankia sp. Cas4]|uniref:RHS domain-containing protein n=1 Tax=Frankia sp. Cas4 TaxID=3073927 RepID=UPI002AD34686